MAKNKNVRNRRQKSRKNSGLRWHKRGIVLTTLVIVLLGVMVTAGSVSLWSRNNAYKAQEAELQAQIEAEETRSEENMRHMFRQMSISGRQQRISCTWQIRMRLFSGRSSRQA